MERFSDLMVKDLVNGECFRADHLLTDNMERMTSDPKCIPEKAKEYAEVVTKVRSHMAWDEIFYGMLSLIYT